MSNDDISNPGMVAPTPILDAAGLTSKIPAATPLPTSMSTDIRSITKTSQVEQKPTDMDRSPTIVSQAKVASPPFDEKVDVVSLSVPVCTPFTRDGIMRGLGTVPVPTQTPTSTPKSIPKFRDPELVKMEVNEYLSVGFHVAKSAQHWIKLTDAIWPDMNDPSNKSALIFAESRRLSALCDAVALAKIPPELEVVHHMLTGTLLDRQRWASEVAAILKGARIAKTPEIEDHRLMASTQLENALNILKQATVDYRITDPDISSSYHRIVNEFGRVIVEVPSGWLVLKADAETLLLAPLEIQRPGVSGIGTLADSSGTTLRIRRLRTSPSRTLNSVSEAVKPLLYSFGEELSRNIIELDGYPGIEWMFTNEANGWDTRFTLVLAGDYVFTFKMQCPQNLRNECELALHKMQGRVTVTP